MEMFYEAASDCFSKDQSLQMGRLITFFFFLSSYCGHSSCGLVPRSLSRSCLGVAQDASLKWESWPRVYSSIALSALGMFAALLSLRSDVIAHLCPSSFELPKSVS